MEYSTLDSLWRQYDAMPRQLSFRARTGEEWIAWRRALRHKLEELLGGFPREKVPLREVRLESCDVEFPSRDRRSRRKRIPMRSMRARQTREVDRYRQEKVAFQTEPGIYVPCHVLLPHGVEPPYRPVIAMHGHGTGGVAHLLGQAVNGAEPQEDLAHLRAKNADYARQLAQHGFMVFVPEQRGFGERKELEPGMNNAGKSGHPRSAKSCRALSWNAMLMGKTILGLWVWDIKRTIDYVRSRPEEMVTGLGCLGLSGGGMATMYASALDDRITTAVVSGYFSSFRASIVPIQHCECNYIPGILEYAEMSDIAGLIAPRPLLVENGDDDHIFPAEATEAAFRDLQRVYELLDVPDRVTKDTFPGGHQFSGREAFDWLDRWL
jgi:dienelactone hydrolase